MFNIFKAIRKLKEQVEELQELNNRIEDLEEELTALKEDYNITSHQAVMNKNDIEQLNFFIK